MRAPPLVLCYHAITDGWNHALALPPDAFEQQLENFLRRGFRPATAADVLDGTGRPLHVTFDDAFVSVERAVPVLERLGIPATVFACPGFADEGRPLDVRELAADADALPKELATMRWDGLGELIERGLEVGSHTVSHVHLTSLGEYELRCELGESRSRLEDGLRRPCRFLAYPYGEHDERVRRAARAAGYEAAFALPGRPRPRDRYAVPRVGIWRGDGPLRVALKTSAPARALPVAEALGSLRLR
jgi:peptidoglycan/xylan/chitin deacetylase (PgdA/CDA1 family)